METRSDYMNRRAREEQAAADRACDSKVRGLHLELADRYREAASDHSDGKADDPPMPRYAGLPSEFRILE